MSPTADLIEWFTRMRVADRRRARAKTAALCAHDVGTPLNVVTGRIGLALSTNADDTHLKAAQKGAQSLTERVQQRLEHTRYPAEPETVRPLEACQTLADRLSPLVEAREAQLDVSGKERACTWNITALEQAISAWLLAGLEAHGGIVELHVAPTSLAEPYHGARPGVYCRIALRLPPRTALDDEASLAELSEEALEGFEGWFSAERSNTQLDITFNLRSHT